MTTLELFHEETETDCPPFAPAAEARKIRIPELKEAGEDFEFYPTTAEIIAAVRRDLKAYNEESFYSSRLNGSLLDIGAGNGKVLLAFADDFHELFAIEKSHLLCQALPEQVLIIGTDFHAQSLATKSVDAIFCNPPYKEYEDWTVKVIREGACQVAYLVIPQRWEASQRIADALRFRDATAKVVGSFDFLNAEDRAARAKVNLIRVTFQHDKEDAFSRLFNELLPNLSKNLKKEDYTREGDGERKERFGQLTVGETYPAALVALHDEEMERTQRNYHFIGELDPAILKEFDISVARVRECFRKRLSGIRMAYWKELFANLDSITSRLTRRSAARVLDRLQAHTEIDFTLDNILAVIIWVIKVSNSCLNDQITQTFDEMVQKANVHYYKSNERTFTEDRWRYNSNERTSSHFKLDYRIVTTWHGGVKPSYEGSSRIRLAETAADFLADLITVGRSFGFIPDRTDLLSYHGREQWIPGDPVDFRCIYKGTFMTFMEVKGFKNGNLHVRFHPDFMLALNTENGRLRGWVKSAKEAAEEIAPEAAQFFGSMTALDFTSSPLLPSSIK